MAAHLRERRKFPAVVFESVISTTEIGEPLDSAKLSVSIYITVYSYTALSSDGTIVDIVRVEHL